MKRLLSVFAAFADLYGLDRETALKLSASFGGGIGRMREICGAFSGISLIAGLKTGCTDPADREGKAANYEKVQQLAAAFKEANGSLICRELLSLSEKKRASETFVPDERTAAYYASRPCEKIVYQAALILEKELNL